MSKAVDIRRYLDELVRELEAKLSDLERGITTNTHLSRNAADWTTINPVLEKGEIGHETDTAKVKIGNGTTAWNSLGYI
jgi:hypothetical protein